MNENSLVKEEILTDGSLGMVNVACGMAGIVLKSHKWLAVGFLVIAFLLEITGFVFRRKYKSHIWDEAARERYAKARRNTMYLLFVLLEFLAMLMLIFQISFELYFWHVVLFCGGLQVILSITFCYLEWKKSREEMEKFKV